MNRKRTRALFLILTMVAWTLTVAPATNAARSPQARQAGERCRRPQRAIHPRAPSDGGRIGLRLDAQEHRCCRFRAGEPARRPPAEEFRADRHREGGATIFAEFGGVFGIRDASQLVLTSRAKDALGTHLTYEQVYRGVPVFGAMLKVHLDKANRLTVVNGVFVPGVHLGIAPTLSAAQAARRAIREVAGDPPGGARVKARDLKPRPPGSSCTGPD